MFFNPRELSNIYKDKMVKKYMVSSKKGQVTIFIILAILIVSVVLAYFFFIKPSMQSSGSKRMKIESCIDGVLDKSLKDLAEKGGMISPKFSYSYNGEEIPYICYSGEYYKTCTVQTPFPEKSFKDNLKKLTKKEVEECFSNSVNSLRRQGYSVSKTNTDFEIDLEIGRVVYRFSDGITVKKGENIQQNNALEVVYSSRIYEQLLIATTILQQETAFGDSDVNNLMESYPEFLIQKLKMGDGTTVYIIKDKASGIEYKFASRSLAWPPGYGLK